MFRQLLAFGASAIAIATAAIVVAWGLARLWNRRDPRPIPYGLRWLLAFPRPFQSAERLVALLRVGGGGHVLEVGPGTGHYSIPIAAGLIGGGCLDVVDVQGVMLERVRQEARLRHVEGIRVVQADASRLPYRDEVFDAAFIVAALGEIPDGDAALRELRRVVKAGGRVVVGEVFVDPDFVRFGRLKVRSERAGLTFRSKVGGAPAYLACFERA